MRVSRSTHVTALLTPHGLPESQRRRPPFTWLPGWLCRLCWAPHGSSCSSLLRLLSFARTHAPWSPVHTLSSPETCCPAHPHPLSDLPRSPFWSAPKCLESTSPRSRLSPLLLCSPHASCCYNVLCVLTALSGAEKGLISGTPATAPCAPPPGITMTVCDPCVSVCLLSSFPA